MTVSGTFNSKNMKGVLGDGVLKDGFTKITCGQASRTTMKLLPAPSGHLDKSLTARHRRVDSVLSTVNKLVKEKLSLGAKIKAGGVEQVFRRIFTVREEERLLRASKCCLFTTAGPIAGRLFISNKKLAFCSDRPIAKVSSPAGESLRFHYKIVIPLTNIKRFGQSENMQKPTEKYIQVLTTDEYEFWFMGFLKYKKTFKCLQQALSKSIVC